MINEVKDESGFTRDKKPTPPPITPLLEQKELSQCALCAVHLHSIVYHPSDGAPRRVPISVYLVIGFITLGEGEG